MELVALSCQASHHPALVDIVMLGGGLGGRELLVDARIGQRVAIGLEHDEVALAETAADALEAVLKKQRVLFRLLAIRDSGVVSIARAVALELPAADGIEGADDVAFGVLDWGRRLWEVRDAVVWVLKVEGVEQVRCARAASRRAAPY